MTCKWDRERETYVNDGEACRTDDYGDPTRHCTARRTCANHVGPDELTCARCIGRTRADIRAIVDRSCDLLPEAMQAGNVNTELANLAGPAADPAAFAARRATGREWIYTHIRQSARGWCEDETCQRRHFKTDEGNRWHKRGIENALADLIEQDDEQHPYVVLTRWEFMLREDYGQRRDDATSITSAAGYLERTLPRLAQDAEQDYPLFSREIRKCRSHLESVLRDSLTPERGAPCPICPAPAPRLNLERGHWCVSEDCTRVHWPQDPDRYVCPRDRDHAWEDVDYRRWVADVYEANRGAAS